MSYFLVTAGPGAVGGSLHKTFSESPDKSGGSMRAYSPDLQMNCPAAGSGISILIADHLFAAGRWESRPEGDRDG
jgi:hypothetical protein